MTADHSAQIRIIRVIGVQKIEQPFLYQVMNDYHHCY